MPRNCPVLCALERWLNHHWTREKVFQVIVVKSNTYLSRKRIYPIIYIRSCANITSNTKRNASGVDASWWWNFIRLQTPTSGVSHFSNRNSFPCFLLFLSIQAKTWFPCTNQTTTEAALHTRLAKTECPSRSPQNVQESAKTATAIDDKVSNVARESDFIFPDLWVYCLPWSTEMTPNREVSKLGWTVIAFCVVVYRSLEVPATQ